MIEQAPSIVWRTDIAIRTIARDSTLQAAPAIHTTAIALNWWGGAGVIWLAAALWLGGRALRRSTMARIGLRGAESLTIASAVGGIIKGLSGRARPFVTPGEPWHWAFNRGWWDAQYFSFPSGHTAATTAFVLAVCLATRGLAPATRAAIGFPLFMSAVGVAMARIYTDQHWFTDVCAAAVIAALTSLLLARMHARSPSPRYDRVMLGIRPVTGGAPA